MTVPHALESKTTLPSPPPDTTEGLDPVSTPLARVAQPSPFPEHLPGIHQPGRYERLRGCAGPGMDTDTLMTLTRGAWQG
ncbi:MAG: hypothetical protein HQL97_03680 [Magnetococcales bacterium]|nr:hypothetical protein [Magnetococcales bacterium]MBF0260933.1 hypothetical protein [Magnetococcales bacterium]